MKMWKVYCFRADKKCRSDSWKSQFSNTSFSPFFIKIKFYHNFNIIPLQGPRSRNTIRASSKFKLSRTGPYVFHITNVQLYKIIPQHVSTYQALHFCVRDVPGASRSELDADCWVSWALYTRHTFAFVGDPSARAQAAVPPRSLFIRMFDQELHDCGPIDQPPLPVRHTTNRHDSSVRFRFLFCYTDKHTHEHVCSSFRSHGAY